MYSLRGAGKPVLSLSLSSLLAHSLFHLYQQNKNGYRTSISVRDTDLGEREQGRQVGRCGLPGKQPALSIGSGYGSRVVLRDDQVGERSSRPGPAGKMGVAG